MTRRSLFALCLAPYLARVQPQPALVDTGLPFVGYWKMDCHQRAIHAMATVRFGPTIARELAQGFGWDR